MCIVGARLAHSGSTLRQQPQLSGQKTRRIGTLLQTSISSRVGGSTRRAHIGRRSGAVAILLGLLLCLPATPAKADFVDEIFDVGAPGYWRLVIGP
jgi:hypothetical protein